jgi:LemA protein
MEELDVNKYDKNLKTKGAGCLGATLFLSFIAIFIIFLSVITYSYYNGLVAKEEKVNAGWADVENLYQRRADLIQNYVETVKGYAKHEKATLLEVIEARASASSIKILPENLDKESIARFEQSQNQLKSSFEKLMVTVEQYPELKADHNFVLLQNQLEKTENGIASQRSVFNYLVREYNTSLRKFPRSIFANMFGFQIKAYFSASEGSGIVPQVKF